MSELEFQARLDASATLREFLFIAGCVAANAQSGTHRAIALRDLGHLGNDWTATLPTARASLVDALVANIHALVAATTADGRKAIALSIKTLVAAARSEPTFIATKTSDATVPRRYWIEADQ